MFSIYKLLVNPAFRPNNSLLVHYAPSTIVHRKQYWSLRPCSSSEPPPFQHQSQRIRVGFLEPWFYRKMSYFVIGLSGVTCGGKTTMAKLLQRSFPWAKVIHQDKYFKPEDHPDHVHLTDIDNHVNFELYTALNMDQMQKDVDKILNSPPEANGYSKEEIVPNFAEGLELLRNLDDIDVDTSRFSHIPILIIEGFIIFESPELYDKCDVRFFLTLDEATCRHRRSLRNFDPPDGPQYFERCIWPEYQHHFKNYVEDRAGIQVYSGKSSISRLWRDSVALVGHKIEEKYPYQTSVAANNNNF